jgi:hypothetical protein
MKIFFKKNIFCKKKYYLDYRNKFRKLFEKNIKFFFFFFSNFIIT